jgi:hypothetical protein
MGRATVRLQMRYIGNDRRATTVTGRPPDFLARGADDAIAGGGPRGGREAPECAREGTSMEGRFVAPFCLGGSAGPGPLSRGSADIDLRDDGRIIVQHDVTRI